MEKVDHKPAHPGQGLIITEIDTDTWYGVTWLYGHRGRRFCARFCFHVWIRLDSRSVSIWYNRLYFVSVTCEWLQTIPLIRGWPLELKNSQFVENQLSLAKQFVCAQYFQLIILKSNS